MAEKKGKFNLKDLKNMFKTKKSSINNVENQNEEINETENSHLEDVQKNSFF